MELDSKSYDEIKKHFNEKVKNKNCVACGENDWIISDTLVEVRSFRNGDLKMSDAVMPLVPIVCSECGNTMLLNTNIINEDIATEEEYIELEDEEDE